MMRSAFFACGSLACAEDLTGEGQKLPGGRQLSTTT
jgi:hypothetical protein